MKLSLVIPCYNEEQNIRPFYDACRNVLHGDVEWVFVNDGSRDGTWSELLKLYESETNIRLVNLSRNFGKESAMYAGLREATGDYVTIIDADLQQHPRYVQEMVDFLDAHPEYDAVAAYQEKRREGKMLSFFKKTFYRLMNRICDTDFRSGASDFRTLRRCVVDSVLSMQEYFRFSKGLFSWVGYNTYYMPYKVEDRRAGKTSWSFGKLVRYAVEGIVAFSTAPLTLAVYLGGIFSALSLLYMVAVVIQKLFFGIDVPGYPTLIVLILLLGGIQMILLGIIGQYIAKIYIEGKKRPIYIAREVLKKDETDA